MGRHRDFRQNAGSTYLTNVKRRLMAAEMREKLKSYSFTHFITLTTNNQDFSLRRMRSALRDWDARINRFLVGPKWQQHPDERLLWFAFPEKIEANPHWHLIAQIDSQLALKPTSLYRSKLLEPQGRQHWAKLVPGGTFDCKNIANEGVIRYVTKELATEENLASFIFYREFH